MRIKKTGTITTAELAADGLGRLALTNAQRANLPVSTASDWTDRIWSLDPTTRGSQRLAVNFASVDGGPFAESARLLVWAMLSSGSAIATAATGAIGVIACLAWLQRNRVTTLDLLSEEAFELHVDDIRQDIDDGGFRPRKRADTRASPQLIASVLGGWSAIVAHGPLLARFGHDAPPSDVAVPFNPWTVAFDLSKRGQGKTQPLPDEIAAQLFAKSARLLGLPADELVAATEMFYGAAEQARAAGQGGAAEAALRRATPDLGFSILPGEERPWWEVPFVTRGRPAEYFEALTAATALVEGAAASAIMASGGMRISEFCSAPAGVNASTGLPACIEVRRTRNEMFELFYIKGTTFKNVDRPVDTEWLIGSRFVGDAELPLAVRAAVVLQRLREPLRRLGDAEAQAALMVAGPPRGVPNDSSSVRPLLSSTVRKRIKEFLASQVTWDDMPEVSRRTGADLRPFKETRGRNVVPTMFRKLLVDFMLQIDNRLLGTLSRHLKHATTAILEDEYLSTDPTFADSVADASAHELARLLVGMARGRPVVGRRADEIRAHLREIEVMTASLEEEEAVATVGRWARERGLGIYVLGPSKCLLQLTPTLALCHARGGTTDWANVLPNFKTRSDGDCIKCRCAVTDGEHVAYWTQRYSNARRYVIGELARTDPADRDFTLRQARVAVEQAAQAASVLRRLGAPVPTDAELA